MRRADRKNAAGNFLKILLKILEGALLEEQKTAVIASR